jgi:hypothetical protein
MEQAASTAHNDVLSTCILYCPNLFSVYYAHTVLFYLYSILNLNIGKTNLLISRVAGNRLRIKNHKSEKNERKPQNKMCFTSE